MSFNIEEYINNLSSDVTEIDVSEKGITFLPDLSRFTNLEKLHCYYNSLTCLPQLPLTLTELDCNFNQLKSLPSLPPILRFLDCNCNQLTNLPLLPSTLFDLRCNNNQLISLPPLPSTIKCLYCEYNQLISMPLLTSTLLYLHCNNNKLINLPKLPSKIRKIYYNDNLIHDIIPRDITHHHLLNSTIINTINSVTLKIYKFRHLYYCLKYKKRFRDLLWIKIREPKIKQYYSPSNLVLLLEGVEDEDVFHVVLSKW